MNNVHNGRDVFATEYTNWREHFEPFLIRHRLNTLLKHTAAKWMPDILKLVLTHGIIREKLDGKFRLEGIFVGGKHDEDDSMTAIYKAIAMMLKHLVEEVKSITDDPDDLILWSFLNSFTSNDLTSLSLPFENEYEESKSVDASSGLENHTGTCYVNVQLNLFFYFTAFRVKLRNVPISRIAATYQGIFIEMRRLMMHLFGYKKEENFECAPNALIREFRKLGAEEFHEEKGGEMGMVISKFAEMMIKMDATLAIYMPTRFWLSNGCRKDLSGMILMEPFYGTPNDAFLKKTGEMLSTVMKAKGMLQLHYPKPCFTVQNPSPKDKIDSIETLIDLYQYTETIIIDGLPSYSLYGVFLRVLGGGQSHVFIALRYFHDNTLRWMSINDEMLYFAGHNHFKIDEAVEILGRGDHRAEIADLFYVPTEMLESRAAYTKKEELAFIEAINHL